VKTALPPVGGTGSLVTSTSFLALMNSKGAALTANEFAREEAQEVADEAVRLFSLYGYAALDRAVTASDLRDRFDGIAWTFANSSQQRQQQAYNLMFGGGPLKNFPYDRAGVGVANVNGGPTFIIVVLLRPTT
jgi:hypothetical protein